MPLQQTPFQSVSEAQSQQRGLTTLLVASMFKIWPLLDLHDLKGTLPGYQTAVAALVRQYGQTSAVLAARFYQARRPDPGFLLMPASPPGTEQVTKATGWSTKGLWGPEPDVKAAQTLTHGVAQQMVVGTGRGTLINAIRADYRCRGWARVARPDACSFCAMLSTRGAVYKNKQTSEFKAHNHCHCLPVPLFASHYEPPAYVREWRALYLQSTRGQSDTLNAFRRAYEGR